MREYKSGSKRLFAVYFSLRFKASKELTLLEKIRIKYTLSPQILLQNVQPRLFTDAGTNYHIGI